MQTQARQHSRQDKKHIPIDTNNKLTLPVVEKRPKLTIKKMNSLPELTADEKIRLKLPPHQAMLNIQHGKAETRDWFDVAFRVVTGYEVAKMHYQKCTIDEFKLAVDVMFGMIPNNQTPLLKFNNDADMNIVSAALRATDILQDTESRQSLIYCSKKARANITLFISRKS